jgi:hypothetical protein
MKSNRHQKKRLMLPQLDNNSDRHLSKSRPKHLVRLGSLRMDQDSVTNNFSLFDGSPTTSQPQASSRKLDIVGTLKRMASDHRVNLAGDAHSKGSRSSSEDSGRKRFRREEFAAHKTGSFNGSNTNDSIQKFIEVRQKTRISHVN